MLKIIKEIKIYGKSDDKYYNEAISIIKKNNLPYSATLNAKPVTMWLKFKDDSVSQQFIGPTAVKKELSYLIDNKEKIF